MKRLMAILTVSVLLASCGNKMTLMKRHYTKGFYVEGTKSTQAPKTLATVKSLKPDEMPAKCTKVSDGMTAPSFVASIKSEPEIIENNAGNRNVIARGSAINSSAKKSLHVKTLLHAHKNALGSHKGGSSDANLIVLVILSLFPFINLIAIYLHDGKNATMNFWLDLILDCLFFFPGIIFALLVVLDVVNLA